MSLLPSLLAINAAFLLLFFSLSSSALFSHNHIHYSTIEPLASGSQASVCHARHARRQRRFARWNGEIAVLGQHIALPITCKTCPGIPPISVYLPLSFSFFFLPLYCALSLSLSLDKLCLPCCLLARSNVFPISRNHIVCCPPICMSYSTTLRRGMPTNWTLRPATRWAICQYNLQ